MTARNRTAKLTQVDLKKPIFRPSIKAGKNQPINKTMCESTGMQNNDTPMIFYAGMVNFLKNQPGQFLNPGQFFKTRPELKNTPFMFCVADSCQKEHPSYMWVKSVTA